MVEHAEVFARFGRDDRAGQILRLRRHHRAHRLLQRFVMQRGRGRRRARDDGSRRVFVHHDPHLQFFPDAGAGATLRHPWHMIEVRDLKKSFGAQPILDGVSFRIEHGESVAIIGRSGGGKSVLLKHIIGLLQPDSGAVLIDDEDIVAMNERQLLRVRRKFGMVFQGAALFDSMTVAENVAFGLRRHEHLTEMEVAKRVAATLDMVDLPGTEK